MLSLVLALEEIASPDIDYEREVPEINPLIFNPSNPASFNFDIGDFGSIPWESFQDWSRIPVERIIEVPAEHLQIAELSPEQIEWVDAEQWAHGDNLELAENIVDYPEAQNAFGIRYPEVGFDFVGGEVTFADGKLYNGGSDQWLDLTADFRGLTIRTTGSPFEIEILAGTSESTIEISSSSGDASVDFSGSDSPEASVEVTDTGFAVEDAALTTGNLAVKTDNTITVSRGRESEARYSAASNEEGWMAATDMETGDFVVTTARGNTLRYVNVGEFERERVLYYADDDQYFLPDGTELYQDESGNFVAYEDGRSSTVLGRRVSYERNYDIPIVDEVLVEGTGSAEVGDSFTASVGSASKTGIVQEGSMSIADGGTVMINNVVVTGNTETAATISDPSAINDYSRAMAEGLQDFRIDPESGLVYVSRESEEGQPAVTYGLIGAVADATFSGAPSSGDIIQRAEGKVAPNPVAEAARLAALESYREGMMIERYSGEESAAYREEGKIDILTEEEVVEAFESGGVRLVEQYPSGEEGFVGKETIKLSALGAVIIPEVDEGVSSTLAIVGPSLEREATTEAQRSVPGFAVVVDIVGQQGVFITSEGVNGVRGSPFRGEDRFKFIGQAITALPARRMFDLNGADAVLVNVGESRMVNLNIGDNKYNIRSKKLSTDIPARLKKSFVTAVFEPGFASLDTSEKGLDFVNPDGSRLSFHRVSEDGALTGDAMFQRVIVRENQELHSNTLTIRENEERVFSAFSGLQNLVYD